MRRGDFLVENWTIPIFYFGGQGLVVKIVLMFSFHKNTKKTLNIDYLAFFSELGKKMQRKKRKKSRIT